MVLQHALQAFLIAGVVSPFSYYAGLTARRLRLPQITGYLVSGIICGPYCLGILSSESVSDLSIIEGACLGIIGLAAGAELQLAELNRSKKQVVSLTTGICLLTWLLCYATITWSASLTPVLHVTPGQLAAIASLGATIMMARSPASAIAVLKEMDAKGPFVSLVMGVVVLKDVAVIVGFALNMELVPMIVDHSAAGFGPSHLLLPLLSVCVSLSAGLLGGSLISLALHHQLQHRLAAGLLVVRRSQLLSGVEGVSGGHAMSHMALAYRCKQAVVLLLSTAVFSVTHSLEAEPLLACVTAGMLLANKRPSSAGAGSGGGGGGGGGESMSHDELASLINSIMALTNVAFFGLAGASLKLSAIADSVWLALVVFVVRLGSIMCGSWLGCNLGGVKSEVQRRCFWMSMVTQAGVAMGLARIAGTAFASEWGASFQTVMMSIIMINMLTGPPLFRAALIQVGEARAVLHSLPLGQQPQQLHRDSSVGGHLNIGGLDSSSLQQTAHHLHHHSITDAAAAATTTSSSSTTPHAHHNMHVQLAAMGGGLAGGGGGGNSSGSKVFASRLSNGSDKSAAAAGGGGGGGGGVGEDFGSSTPPVRQRGVGGHGEQQLRSLLHVPQQQQQQQQVNSSRAGQAGVLLDPGGSDKTTAAGAGAAVDGGGGSNSSHHVVMSSGVLLHHLGGGGSVSISKSS